jgi:hypothetical protein
MKINHGSGEADKKPIEDEKNAVKTNNYVTKLLRKSKIKK